MQLWPLSLGLVLTTPFDLTFAGRPAQRQEDLKQDGSLAQQIRRAAAAAEAEDLEELRRGLRSDVLGARRLFEEQQQAEARWQEEQAELRDCVARGWAETKLWSL
ncbi:hypothetical protein AK812_SmicGene36197 [Symbiodinium microadriaticum]|uniref:Uncharacterized protein n=1 Tax=Symbiodinium microadriaticum TaxID=2951 RepID=A0A1Q9CJI6_SYMMI|nr:hypothetical protein AK812_SmicGene36197 [Symbiodinium microadriaticum]